MRRTVPPAEHRQTADRVVHDANIDPCGDPLGQHLPDLLRERVCRPLVKQKVNRFRGGSHVVQELRVHVTRVLQNLKLVRQSDRGAGRSPQHLAEAAVLAGAIL